MALTKKEYEDWKQVLQIKSAETGISTQDLALINKYYSRASESQIEKLPKYLKRALGLEEMYEGELYGKGARFRKWENE